MASWDYVSSGLTISLVLDITTPFNSLHTVLNFQWNFNSHICFYHNPLSEICAHFLVFPLLNLKQWVSKWVTVKLCVRLLMMLTTGYISFHFHVVNLMRIGSLESAQEFFSFFHHSLLEICTHFLVCLGTDDCVPGNVLQF